MRKVIAERSWLGSVDIGAIKLDAEARDDIPALLNRASGDLRGRGDADGAVSAFRRRTSFRAVAGTRAARGWICGGFW